MIFLALLPRKFFHVPSFAPKIYVISKWNDAGEGVKKFSAGLASPNRSDNSSTTKRTTNLELSTLSSFSKSVNFLSTEEVEVIKSSSTRPEHLRSNLSQNKLSIPPDLTIYQSSIFA